MARIAFFTERLPPDLDPISRFSYDLIRSLADQSHEVRVFSTYQEGAELPPPHSRIEILRPFRRWSWMELPRLIPLLLSFQPEILHLIQPHKEALRGVTNAMSAVSGFAPVIGRPPIVSSFYDLHEEDLKKHRLILLASQAITVSNEMQLGLLTRFLASHGRNPQVFVLPVPAGGLRLESAEYEETQVPPLPEALAAFLESPRDLILVPGEVSSHRAQPVLFSALAKTLETQPDAAVLITGGWGRVPLRERHELLRPFGTELGSRILLTGQLTPEHERRALARARVVFAPALPPESLGLASILRGALETSTPVLISREQAQIDALPWRHGENALIAERPEDWGTVLTQALAKPERLDRIRARLGEFSRAEAVDQPGNVMSRIYSQISQDARRRAGPRAGSNTSSP